MSLSNEALQALSGTPVRRARVTGRDEAGRIAVADLADGRVLLCDVLLTGSAPPVYEEGDDVLVLALPERPVLLGRIGRAAAAGEPAAAAATPESRHEKRLVLEADEEILLRVGEASIRITADGKVVVRGEHVLTRAKGTNRIKGGSVAIN